MMNYIWSGLILISILFAVGGDIHDELYDAFENGRVYDIEIINPSPRGPVHGESVTMRLTHCNVNAKGTYQSHKDQLHILVEPSDRLPQQWKERYQAEDSKLLITVVDHQHDLIQAKLPEIYLKRLKNMMQAAFDMAEFAASLALGLIGLMALWLGMMKIAEDSGLVNSLVKLVRPILKPLFPDIPSDHPAMGAISMNLAANMLGLGNAATPLGIKAMQHLQELNEHKDNASHSMCMFLALNTSSVQLLPPVTVIALLGVNAGGLFISIFLATLCSTIVAILASKWYAHRVQKAEQS